MFEKITDAWDSFSDLHGSETPVWTRDDLAAWLHAEGYVFDDHIRYLDDPDRRYVTAEALDLAYEAEMAEVLA